jgi:hypothetical protein
MTEPVVGRLYEIELCSGELCRWRFLGADARGQRWWRDSDSGREFSEASLMYAWTVVGEVSPLPPATPPA